MRLYKNSYSKAMVLTTYSEARAKLASLMDKVVEDADEVRITRRGKPDVVLLVLRCPTRFLRLPVPDPEMKGTITVAE